MTKTKRDFTNDPTYQEKLRLLREEAIKYWRSRPTLKMKHVRSWLQRERTLAKYMNMFAEHSFSNAWISALKREAGLSKKKLRKLREHRDMKEWVQKRKKIGFSITTRTFKTKFESEFGRRPSREETAEVRRELRLKAKKKGEKGLADFWSKK